MAHYTDELAGLQAAYAEALEQPGDDLLKAAFGDLRGRSLYAVGSGGTLPVAEFAADLHHSKTGQFALAITPLRFLEVSARTSHAAVIVFSARAKHPDTGLVVEHAIARGIPIVLVTQREVSELEGPLASPSVTVLTVPSAQADGFLATRSVLMMATVVARFYGKLDLPAELPGLTIQRPENLNSRVLVLHAQDGRAAAVDVETRMHELGLVTVQVADYRNLAHGRHVGLERNWDESTIIALVGPASDRLATKTLGLLPERLDVHRIETSLEGAAGSLDLLASVMSLPRAVAAGQSVEPSKPTVPVYGRGLYHLPYKRLYVARKVGPIGRKIQAAGFDLANDEVWTLYMSAYADWIAEMRRRPIGALVLDYDGTCVTTTGRYEVPNRDVQQALIGLLSVGTPVTFASGRGGSLYEDLRKWVPEKYWHMISLGLHNGAWRVELAEDLMEARIPVPLWSEQLQMRLRPFEERGLIKLRTGPSQITVTSDAAEMTSAGLRQLVTSVVDNSGAKLVRIAASGHSVDVIDVDFGKERIFASTVSRYGSALAIGDQGQPGGNDFALLASTLTTVSVDCCSADPTRCWNIAGSGSRGPQALVETLSKLKDRRGQLYLSVKSSDH
ncbi:hypothetical protein [Arthrobacter sp. B6]|uniref:hypothetical protein n=1 Tax=Arthrobacter sp. B6 TaxID=1570137 RepID=UPI000AE8F53E|nr:hypothetical protein [Arthrobacter sp. B6]